MTDPKKPEYGAASLVLGLLSILCLILIIVGAAVVLFTMIDLMDGPRYARYGMADHSADYAKIFAGLIASLTGLFGLAGVQISQAVIDNSTISWHILQELRKAGRAANGPAEPVLTVKGTPMQKTLYTRDGKPVVATRDASGVVTAQTYVGIKEFSSFEEAADYFK
jgi:hypothetical protein